MTHCNQTIRDLPWTKISFLQHTLPSDWPARTLLRSRGFKADLILKFTWNADYIKVKYVNNICLGMVLLLMFDFGALIVMIKGISLTSYEFWENSRLSLWWSLSQASLMHKIKMSQADSDLVRFKRKPVKLNLLVLGTYIYPYLLWSHLIIT